MGASGEIDGGAVDMEKEIDKHMKEVFFFAIFFCDFFLSC